MAYVLTVANQKGGVGKTQTAANLAYAIAQRDQRVLAIDADPQSSLTLYMGCEPVELDQAERCLHHSILDGRPLREVIERLDDFDLVASSIKLAWRSRELILKFSGLDTLRRALEPVREEYDFVVIDTPPSFSELFLNTLVASDGVLIPVKTDRMSAYGFTDLLESIKQIQTQSNPRLEVFGVVPTMYQKGYRVDEVVLEELRSYGAGRFRLFDPVRRSTNFDKAFDEAIPALKLFPRTPGIDAYERLADELIATIQAV